MAGEVLGDGVCLCSEHLGGSRESPQGPVHLLGMHSESVSEDIGTGSSSGQVMGVQ